MGAVVGVLTSQSRGAVITAVVMVLAMLGLTAVGRQAKRSVIALCVAAAVCGVAVMAVDSYDSDIFYRYSSIAPSKALATTQESRAGTWAAIPDYMREIPLGAGIGSGGPAAGLWDTRPVVWNAESQFTFLIVEAGIPGLVVFLAFQGAVFTAILSGLRRERDPRTAVLLAGLAAPLFGYAVNWLIGINTTSTPNSAYLWLAIGVISYWCLTGSRRAAPQVANG
jgi:O-antigen ligase